MISGFDPYDLDLLKIATAAYGPCDVNSDLAHVLTLLRDDALLIAFRGTELSSLADLATDADVLPTLAPDIDAVSDGLYRSTCSVAWRVLPLALAAFSKGMRIMVTGHSKGGGEAQIFVAELAAIGVAAARLTVFEPYRSLGPKAQAMIAGVPGLATRNGCDPVPALPPRLTQRPITQLGPAQITFAPLADHALAAVSRRFLALAAPTAPA